MRRRIASVVACSLLLVGCVSDHRPQVRVRSAAPVGWFRACADNPPAQPSALPAASKQAAPTPDVVPPAGLDGRRWPTNQWWTSWLTGQPQPLWSPPLVVTNAADGIGIGSPQITAAPNSISSSPAAAITLTIAHDAVSVEDWGDFHVRAALISGRSTVGVVTVAQGSAATWVATTSPSLRPAAAVPPSSDLGTLGAQPVRTDVVWWADLAGRRWDVVSSEPVSWVWDGALLRATTERPVTIGIVAAPENPPADWPTLARASGIDPVIGTTADWQVTATAVSQRLTWRRQRNGAGVIVALPHQQPSSTGNPVAGSYRSHLGSLQPILGDTIEWSTPSSGLLLGVPRVPLADGRREQIVGVLAREAEPVLAADSIESAGSYFGPKELGRIATLADVAAALGSPLAARLRATLTDRLDRWFGSAASPDRWLAYEGRWGGLTASSPEFGHQDYNDHHFQYGYLLQAAATVAEYDSAAAARWAPTIDLIIGDLGADCVAGFPRLRVMNAYLGHSAASGFSPFVDGINQESSSEAVHAWWSLARWAAATGDEALGATATAWYETEALAARTYWLGIGNPRPAPYAHEVAGIVWGGKLDFATFFDARPASVVGIQLLPFTFGSLYRNDPIGAQRRYAAGSEASGSRWQDLLAMDLALAEPDRAMSVIDAMAIGSESFEEGTSETFARYWVASLAALGPPDPTYTSEPAYGVAFTGSQGTTLVAHNPTASTVRVVFRTRGNDIATIEVPAHGTVLQRP